MRWPPACWPEESDETPGKPARSRNALLIVLAMAQFMVVLDGM